MYEERALRIRTFYERQPVKSKEEVCGELNTDRVEFQVSDEFSQNKILVQEISIKALRIYLTFRI